MLEVTRPGWREYLDKTRVAALAGCEPSHVVPTACKELLDNALDESPAGGVTYKVGDRSLTVHDTGRGMSEELACRIFSINRASVSTKRWRMARRGMLGNGSRIVMAAVHISGGTLIIESGGLGFRVAINGVGGAEASGHFDSDVKTGTRITAHFGQGLEWRDPSIYCHNALLAEGTAWPSRRASASFFTAAEIMALMGDVAPGTPIRDFAGMFDLSTAVAAKIKSEFRNRAACDIAAQETVATEAASMILNGAQPPKQLRRIGRNMLPRHEYGFEETVFCLGSLILPAVVEVWALGEPVPDREKSGAICFQAIYLNRAPGLLQVKSHGSISPHTNDVSLVVGNAEISLQRPVKGPCNFALVLAITAPDLPIISLGKAVDYRPFANAIEKALSQALPKAYVKPEMTLAEAKALRRDQEAPLREAEQEAAQRRKLAEERDRAARRRERLAKIASEAGRLHGIYLEETEGAELPRGAFPLLKNDPFDIGRKEEMHVNGAWLAASIDRLSAGTMWTPTHIRGLHYRMLSRGDIVKPDGQIYGHGAGDHKWLQDEVVRPARWLEYVPFSYIFDQRSDPPIIPPAEAEAVKGDPRIDGVSAFVPQVDSPPSPAEVSLHVATFFPRRRNQYQIVIVGEKSGLRELVAPIAAEFHAVSYFPAGEISDTHISEIAERANADGRELVVLYLADCDPSGRQMPVSVSQKLRAIRDLYYPTLRFRVVSAALNPEQAVSLGLPQSPIKETEARAERWNHAFGIEQIEIDALLELMPARLVEMLRTVAGQFVDATLHDRTDAAEAIWQQQAQSVADAALQQAGGQIATERAEAQRSYSEALRALEAYRNALRRLGAAMEAIKVDLASVGDPPEVPEPILAPEETDVLVSGDMTLVEHIARLFDRKNYGQDEGDAA